MLKPYRRELVSPHIVSDEEYVKWWLMIEYQGKHFGLLDEDAYLETTIRILNSYGENGIFLGDNLLITYETSRYPLSTKMMDGMLQGM